MAKQPVKLYVVHHGKTIFNALDRMQGVGTHPSLRAAKKRSVRSVDTTPLSDATCRLKCGRYATT